MSKIVIIIDIKDDIVSKTPFLILYQNLKLHNCNHSRSRVHLKEWPQMESYAGFFKVNETYNSHLYFWFFPSQSKPSEDPVILWLQVSSGIFILLGLIVKN